MRRALMILAAGVFSLAANEASADVEACHKAFWNNEYDNASKPCETAARKGDVLAQYLLGWMYATGTDVKQNDREAAHWFRLSAEQGDPISQFNLANMYRNGIGITQNYAEAMRLYKMSAEQGNARAKTNLANMYFSGKGVEQDYEKAAHWYRLSAKQGNSSVQLLLGNMYESGQGVEKDFITSHMWYNISAANGKKTAFDFRDRIAEMMTTEQLAEAQSRAQRCIDSEYEQC